MEIQLVTQTTYSNQKIGDINTSTIEKEFKLENKISESKYTEDELQYIRNYSKINQALLGTNTEESEKSAKNIIDSNNNTKLTSGVLPSGIKLTDEFANALLATSKELSKSEVPIIMVMLLLVNSPTLDDSRYYTQDTDIPVLKNDPEYPINEYGKEKFESNETILNMLNDMVQSLSEWEKPTNFTNTFKKVGEMLLRNLNKEINKSEDEKSALLKNITKNNKPNLLIDIK